MFLFFKSTPKLDRDFYKMLYNQSEKTLEGVGCLCKYCHTLDAVDGNRVIEIEQEADELRRILISVLEQTFITPFEREDIYSLSRMIDDVIDYCATTVDEFRMFGLDRDQKLLEMIELLYEESNALNNAIKYLKDHKSISTENIVKVKYYENQIESVYREAIVELLNSDDFKYIFKMREIYRHVSNASDRGDEAANVLGRIIVKLL